MPRLPQHGTVGAGTATAPLPPPPPPPPPTLTWTLPGNTGAMSRHRRYTQHRDEEVRPRTANGDPNEVFLFHGTSHRDPKELLLAHGDDGLDPRVGSGGFYGQGTYLAQDACYPIAGRYAYRSSTRSPNRFKFLVVRVALGTCCDLGVHVDSSTRQYTTPPVRVQSRPPVKYCSIRAGPHRPFQVSGHLFMKLTRVGGAGNG